MFSSLKFNELFHRKGLSSLVCSGDCLPCPAASQRGQRREIQLFSAQIRLRKEKKRGGLGEFSPHLVFNAIKHTSTGFSVFHYYECKGSGNGKGWALSRK